MNRKFARRLLMIIFAAACFLNVASASAEECSLLGAAGNWSFSDSGTVIGVGPRRASGIFTLDANGKVVNGKATSSLNGSIADETFYGTYSVSQNCRGKLTVKIFSSGAELFKVTIDLAFDGNMQQVRGIFTSVVEPNGTSLSTVIGIQASKQ
jgi:hypothetical protein